MDLINAQELARLEMAKHPLAGWVFRFDNGKRRFGYCHFIRRFISLSRPLTLLNSEAEVHDTILHEIAHALAGPMHGHDEEWKRIAASIGAKPVRCYDSAEVNTVPYVYIGRCSNCGEITSKRYKMTRSMRKGLFHPPCSRNAKIIFTKER